MSHLTNIMVGSFRGVHTGVDRYFGEITTTQVRIIPHVHPKFEVLNL